MDEIKYIVKINFNCFFYIFCGYRSTESCEWVPLMFYWARLVWSMSFPCFMTALGCSQIYTFPTAGYGSLQKLAFIITHNICFQIHMCATIVLGPGNFLASLSVLWIHTHGFRGFVFMKQSLFVAQEGLKKLSCLSLHSNWVFKHAPVHPMCLCVNLVK